MTPHPPAMPKAVHWTGTDAHHLPEPSRPPREVTAMPHVGQAGQGYEGKLVTGPPSQEVPALAPRPGLGVCKPLSEPPSHRPCLHSLVQWVSGRNLLCASSTRHAVRKKIHASRSCSLEPTTATCPWCLEGVSVCLARVTVCRWRQGFRHREHHRSKQVWEERRREELGFKKLRRACGPSREEGA